MLNIKLNIECRENFYFGEREISLIKVEVMFANTILDGSFLPVIHFHYEKLTVLDRDYAESLRM